MSARMCPGAYPRRGIVSIHNMESQTQSKGGRPTKYHEKYVDELIAYFESFVEEPFTKEVIREETSYYDADHGGGMKNHRVEHKFIGKRLPTLFGFARRIGVNYTTVYRWAEGRIGKMPPDGEKDTRPYQYPEFRNAYKARVHYQTEFLTALGLGGIAPPAAYVFTAKNVLGWRDASEIGFVDEKGKRTAPPGYVLLPQRKTEAEANAEFEQQNPEAPAAP